MRKNFWVVLMVLIVPVMLFTVSCAKEAVRQQPAVTEAPKPAPADDSAKKAEQARIEAERLRAEQMERAKAEARANFENKHVYYEFDSSALTSTAQQLLKDKADYLSKNSGVKITIEGHCDERGTDAYNMALGERRAQSAKDFLVNSGIDAGRMNIISFGEERPLDPAQTEAAWAKNRRAQFVVK